MLIRSLLTTAAIAAVAAAAPASALTNLINNGSFENGFAGFTHSAGTEAYPAVVILYNNAAAYGTNGGAFGEAVTPDNSASASPDAVGTHGAYFVDDAAVNETISQITPLHVGNYKIGFSAYLPQNGANNPIAAVFDGSIINIPVAHFTTAGTGATHWYNFSGVASITQAGYYTTSFVYNTPNAGYAADIVIDRVYVIPTTEAPTVLIPPTPTSALPEPASWGLMIAGFGLIGVSMRRRSKAVAA